MMRSLVRLSFIFAGLSSVAGCAAPKPATKPVEAHSLTLDTPTTVVSADEATDIETLLSRAQAALDQGEHQRAAREFELIVGAAQKPHERVRALLGWGTALDMMGEPAAALSVYERYVKEAPQGAQLEEVRVRQVRLLTYLERYSEAAHIGSRVEGPVPPLAQVAIFAGLALDALEQDHPADAELAIARARSVIEAERFDSLDPVPLDVAAVYFALGELRRRRALDIVFDPLPKDFAEALEARCQWILDAQSAYSQAMRARDAHWSAMAGVAVGDLYHRLHKELMHMPKPVGADSQARRELFEGALRLRYSILLTKASSMLRATLALAERDRAHGAWAARARKALSDIEAAEQEEQRALARLPYTRAQLEQALADLAQRGDSSVGQK